MACGNPVQSMREIAAEQRRFDQDVALLRARPGPALCESLLRCYFAGKSYDYDPFNATRFLRLGKLDVSPILEEIHQHGYGAIQLDGPIQDEKDSERFEPSILAAIQSNYVPALEQEDTVIYVPKVSQSGH
jgi:hypothetical protein